MTDGYGKTIGATMTDQTTTTSETEIRIPLKDTADFDADILLRIEDDRIFFEVDDIRGRGGRGYLTPDQARQTAAALVRIATTLDPPTSGTGPGAVEREKYGRVLYECMREQIIRESPNPADTYPLVWDDIHERHRRRLPEQAAAVIAAYLADHAADPGARRDRVADDWLMDLETVRETLIEVRTTSPVHATHWGVPGAIDAVRRVIAALAAPNQPARAEGAGNDA